MKRVAVFAAALMTMVASGASRAAVLFSDDFTEGSYSYTADTSGGNQGGVGQALSNGFSRGIKIVNPTLAVDGLDSVTTRVFTGAGGLFDYSSTAGADAATLLQYQTTPTSQVTGLTSTSVVHLDFAALDAPVTGPTTVKVVLNPFVSDEWDSSTYTLDKGGAQTLDIPLTGLSNSYPGTTWMQIWIDTPAGADYRLNSLSIEASPTPEPATLGLIGLSALALRRRRRRA